jgi:dTMP kinase
MPDITFLIDIPVDVADIRKRGIKLDRIEVEGMAFYQKVREGYLLIAREEPDRVFVVDGLLPRVTIADKIWNFLNKRVREYAGMEQ